MKIELYGIVTCDSCRKAKKWLESESLDFEWTDLRSTPPSAETVARWVEALGSKALRNTSGASYRALGDEKKSWDDQRWTDAFSQDPMLLKRPVLVVDGVALCAGFKADVYASSLW